MVHLPCIMSPAQGCYSGTWLSFRHSESGIAGRGLVSRHPTSHAATARLRPFPFLALPSGASRSGLSCALGSPSMLHLFNLPQPRRRPIIPMTAVKVEPYLRPWPSVLPDRAVPDDGNAGRKFVLFCLVESHRACECMPSVEEPGEEPARAVLSGRQLLCPPTVVYGRCRCDLTAVPPRSPRSALVVTVIPEDRMTCRTYLASAPNTLSEPGQMVRELDPCSLPPAHDLILSQEAGQRVLLARLTMCRPPRYEPSLQASTRLTVLDCVSVRTKYFVQAAGMAAAPRQLCPRFQATLTATSPILFLPAE